MGKHVEATGPSPEWGLGLDGGGTQTRWALADRTGTVVAEGSVDAMGGLALTTTVGVQGLRLTLQALAAAVTAYSQESRLAVYGGFTGLGDTASVQAMHDLLASVLPLATGHVTLTHDMDIAYRAAFSPGQGYLVYAGTGSIASYIDVRGQAHRAGGLGPALGDEGGGYWIAREALALVWRNEDRQPGAWRTSPMAQRIFDAVGGSDWAASRQFMYTSDRGTIGKLALQVGASAHDDAAARQLLLRAGAELAQLAQHLLQRFGPRPLMLAGRAQCISPLIERGLRAGLPGQTELRGVPDLQAHRAAAQWAVTGGPGGVH
jgi:N-acetylglucosamine kinase-like BadF-type ATPase